MQPVPTRLFHFTHIDNLITIIRKGLLPEVAVRQAGLLRTDVGHQDIKAARRAIQVPVPPGGVVANYVPFYYAPRSPMMYAIDRGRVQTYRGGCDELVYLVTSVENLAELGVPTVFTDRNASMMIAQFTNNRDDLEHLVDWPLMRARMWNDTPEQPDRRERRMAECMAHERVPWGAFGEVAARNAGCRRRVLGLFAAVGGNTPVSVRPRWYFEGMDGR